MAEESAYSLWVRPHGSLAHKLQDRINELSKAYITPRFEPHLTLLGGLRSNQSELISLSNVLAHSLTPFSIELTEVGTGSDYFHCVFIKAKKTKALMHAHESAAKIFEVNPDADVYKPHVSLIYGNLSLHEKERLINKMGRSYYTDFEVRNLLLVKTSGSPNQWEKIHSVDITS